MQFIFSTSFYKILVCPNFLYIKNRIGVIKMKASSIFIFLILTALTGFGYCQASEVGSHMLNNNGFNPDCWNGDEYGIWSPNDFGGYYDLTPFSSREGYYNGTTNLYSFATWDRSDSHNKGACTFRSPALTKNKAYRFYVSGDVWYVKLVDSDTASKIGGDVFYNTSSTNKVSDVASEVGWKPIKPTNVWTNETHLFWSHSWEGKTWCDPQYIVKKKFSSTSYTVNGTSINLTGKPGFYTIRSLLDSVESSATNTIWVNGSKTTKISEPDDNRGMQINEEIQESKIINVNTNPSNPFVSLNYTIGEINNVNISIYDLMGKKVTELVNEQKDHGKYSIIWNAGSAVPSGVYLVVLQAGNKIDKTKVTLLK